MKAALWSILALFLLLALGYNRATPFGAPPDERPHALYVEHLVSHGTLPVLRREQRDAYEAHQPPLYYLLAVPSRSGPRWEPGCCARAPACCCSRWRWWGWRWRRGWTPRPVARRGARSQQSRTEELTPPLAPPRSGEGKKSRLAVGAAERER